jgi:DNA polymerase III gamma/tau subunit
MNENAQIKPLEQITNLIAQGNLKEAIAQLSELLKHTKHLDEVLQQSARFNDIKKQIRLGIVDFESAELTKNKITFALIELMNEIDEAKTNNKVVEKEIEQYEEKLNQEINIENAGIVAMKGNVNIQGEYVAGRDMTIGAQPKKKKSFWNIFGK